MICISNLAPNQNEIYLIKINKVNDMIYEIKCCFPNYYRKFEPASTKYRSIYVYKDDPFFAIDGCYTLHLREFPDQEDILTHLEQITKLKRNQLKFEK